jgi:hypothetical protein
MSPQEAHAALLGERNVAPVAVLLMAAKQIELDPLRATLDRMRMFDSIGFAVDPTMFRDRLHSRNYEANKALISAIIAAVEALRPHLGAGAESPNDRNAERCTP